MLFRTQFSLLGLLILWLAQFTGLSSSTHSGLNHHSHTHYRRAATKDLTNYSKTKLNLHAHTYEKLFLWEAYSIIVQTEGADKQKLILPFRTKEASSTSVTPGKSNRHVENDKATNKALNYGEFMLRLRDLISDITPAPTITEPTSIDDLQKAEKQLAAGQFKGEIKLNAVSPYILTDDGNNANSGRSGGTSTGGETDGGSDSSDSRHIRFIQTVTKKVAAIKDDAEKMKIGDVSDRVGRASEISDRLVKIRQGATNNWLIGELSNENTWDLQESYTDDEGKKKYRSTVATIPDADTGVPGMPKYQGIDFPATYSANTAKVNAQQISTGEDFQTWASELGNSNPSTTGPKETKPNVNHWQEIKAWENFFIDCI